MGIGLSQGQEQTVDYRGPWWGAWLSAVSTVDLRPDFQANHQGLFAIRRVGRWVLSR